MNIYYNKMRTKLDYTESIKDIYLTSWRNGIFPFLFSLLLFPIYLLLITSFKLNENLK